MKKYWIVFTLLGFYFSGYSQAFVTKNGMIRFYSETKLEKIEAVNRQVNVAFMPPTGDFFFKVLIKSFNFEKALMQEHFNENYLESAKYPDATFVGKITNYQEINFKKDGTYPANVEGKLTIHGQTRQVKQTGTLEIKNGLVTARAKFSILLADYNISVPNTVVNNISKSIEITVEATMAELNKN
ncbi:MAG: YceI family protein [Bacteroidetes bacterium]|nr:YceI family protein [Bacteroidota bacterium]